MDYRKCLLRKKKAGISSPFYTACSWLGRMSRYTILLFCINNTNTEWGVGCSAFEQATEVVTEQNGKVRCHNSRLAVTCTVVARCPERWHAIQNLLLGQHCTADVWVSVKKQTVTR